MCAKQGSTSARHSSAVELRKDVRQLEQGENKNGVVILAFCVVCSYVYRAVYGCAFIMNVLFSFSVFCFSDSCVCVVIF